MPLTAWTSRSSCSPRLVRPASPRRSGPEPRSTPDSRHGWPPTGSPPGSATRAGSPPTSPAGGRAHHPGCGHQRRRLHPRTGRRRHRARPGGQRVLPGQDVSRGRAGAQHRRHGRAVRRPVERFPVWSIEEGLAEDDWDGWRALTERLGDRVQLVGDDIFVTNPVIIADAVSRQVGNATLIKVNQNGTVTETLDALAVCRDSGYTAMVSHRSGETEDTFISDLTGRVGLRAAQVRRSSSRRASREVQPAAGHRRHLPRTSLRRLVGGVLTRRR